MVKWAEPGWRWTEQDWILSLDSDEMLSLWDLLVEQTGVRTSQRKFVLFMTSCLRRIQQTFKDERTRIFADTLEQFADGVLTLEEVNKICARMIDPPNPDNVPEWAGPGVEEPRESHAWSALTGAAPPLQGYDFPWDARSMAFAASKAAPEPKLERQAQAALLREIFGNPFHPVALDPSSQRWNDSAVVKIARRIYDQRDFDQMQILADALEDAGCTDQSILAHCRTDGPHVRGCWVIDLLLGKN